MKLYVWKYGHNFIIRDDGGKATPSEVCLGTIEVTEPPKPKHTVTKEARNGMREYDGERGTQRILFPHIPLDAKNIKCTYEVDE